MASELLQQVARLRQSNAKSASIHSGTASLFLEAKEASKLEITEVYRAALRGLETLCQYNRDLEPYIDSIFHESSMTLQRELKTSKENATLNSELNHLLSILSLYNSLPQMHLVLEYMIRRYRVHEFNANDIIGCMITQHDSKVKYFLTEYCQKQQ